MTEDVNEQAEAEEMGEEVNLETEGAAPRRKGGGFWAVTTLIFMVATAVLVWLYTGQIDELEGLRAEADQARSQVVRLQQANRQVSTELAELMDKLREVVRVVDELEGVEEPQPTAQRAAAQVNAPAAEAERAEIAPEPPESQPTEVAKPAEKGEASEEARPRRPVPRPHPVSPGR